MNRGFAGKTEKGVAHQRGDGEGNGALVKAGGRGVETPDV